MQFSPPEPRNEPERCFIDSEGLHQSQCDYGRLFMTAAVARNPFFKPQSQRGLRLMAQP